MRTVLARAVPARNAESRRTAVRRMPAVLAAAALVAVALTGCTSAAGSASCVQPGDASRLVHPSGDFASPSAHFPDPLQTTTLQKSVVEQGTGEQLVDGQLATFDATYYEGTTGTHLGSQATAMVAGGHDQFPGVQKALLCATVKSRIVVTGTATQVLGAQASSIGLTGSNTVVAVIDIHGSFLARANGAPRPAQPGMPTVVLAPNGQPGIKIPAHDAPTTLNSAVLKQGSGATIKKNDHIVVNYTAVTWNSPNVVASSSWTNGSPVLWPDTSGQSYSPPASVLAKLVGQQVGSQLIVVTPGSNATAIVIDILGIWK